jgi:SET domain-containing protein
MCAMTSAPVTAGDGLYVAASALHGRGVFTSRAFAAGELIEECPVLIIPKGDRPLVDQTSFSGYYFEWKGGAGGLALGFGSLYNHSYRPNARYDPGPGHRTLRFTAVKAIKPGCEITINYNGSPTSRKKLWFEPAGR